jgi:glycerol-3-phosphate O-acyltransferase / dihydroxyacetone phosphate acyltransferase
MVYNFLKFLMMIAIRTYYRRIELKGIEKIPTDRPVILACNHPNAFMDAIVVAVFMNKPLHFLARSDAFNTPLKKWLLTKMKVMPIYRIQEGADQLHKNGETFEKCAKLLSNNAAIIMFPEGICVQERRLRKLRKGLGRIAFGAEEIAGFNLKSCIVPIGINYTKPSSFNGDLVLKAGKIIEISDFTEEYKKDKAKAINSFTSKLESEMARQLVIISDPSDDELMKHLDQLFEDEKLPTPSPFECFKASREIALKLESFKKGDFRIYTEMQKRTFSYFSVIYQEGFKNRLLSKTVLEKNLSAVIGKKVLLLAFTFPFFVLGFIINFIPFRAPYLLSKRMVKYVEFFASINFILGAFIFIFWYIGLSIITGYFFSSIFVPVLLVVGPFTGKFGLNYLALYKEVQAVIKMKQKTGLAQSLLEEKEILLNLISQNLIKV